MTDIKDLFKKPYLTVKNAVTLTYGLVLGIIFFTVFVVTLYLLFRSYTITLDYGDGRESASQTYNINSGDITLTMPERAGYRFIGWTGSNGYTPQRTVTVGRGTLGDKLFIANWSDELTVTCEDWVIDQYGNRLENITAGVDAFLESGESSKSYEVQPRTITVKPGSMVDAATWGDDPDYKAYHANYAYTSSSGETEVNEDDVTVYRYFYPILDVNYQMDENEYYSGQDQGDIATFDLYIGGELIGTDLIDYCQSVPCGATYEIRNVQTKPGYRYSETSASSGTMGANRISVVLLFYSD